jgi:hypothetical protein
MMVTAVMITGSVVGTQALTASRAEARVGSAVYMTTSPSDSSSPKYLTVWCPGGMRVLGGGGRLYDDDHKVSLVTMIPVHTATGDGYTVTAIERPGGHSGAWSVRAHAICANPLNGMEIVVAGPTSRYSHVAEAVCPAGKVVVGTGAGIGAAELGTSLQTLYPIPNRNSVIASGVDPYGNAPPDFAVIAVAVCAERPAGYRFHTDSATTTSDNELRVSVSCVNGQTALGTGYSLSDYNNSGHVVDLYTHWIFAAARAYWSEQRRTWGLTVWVICAD